MPQAKVSQLEVPPFVQEQGGSEVLRAFIDSQNGLNVSLIAGFESPSIWGILLVDVARHVARIFSRDGSMTEEQALTQIRKMFDNEWRRPTDPGTTHSTNN